MNREQRWSYVEPAGPERNPTEPDAPFVVTRTEQEILDEYWEWWRSQMLKLALVKPVEISEEACIEDWVTVHWASKV